MKACIPFLSLVLTSFFATNAFCWTVPSTGIIKCYNDTEEIACPSSNEPFYGQNGNYPGQQHTYTTDADTVTDTITGLVWQRTPDGQARNIGDAVTYCEALTLGGQSGWRLPRQRELVTIVDHALSSPAWAAAFDGANDLYWSATTYQGYAGQYWYVKFTAGTSEFGPESDTHAVRCVRGQPLAESVFVDQGTTVRDATTGLVWEKAGSDAGMTWEQALSYCQASTTGGKSDWRLPNIMELRTLVDYARVFPAIDETLFPDSDHPFRTGSTNSDYPSIAWQVSFNMGDSANDHKGNTAAYARCVRDAPQASPTVAPIVSLLLQ